MADKRMFAKSIIESDSFMDMPAEAQMLYVHLNMASDDDGFCDNPRTVMRQCGASSDSMKILIARKFVLTFEKNDGFIVVIKHWRMNNYIRRDTYRETKYKEYMRELYFDENQSYTMNPGEGHSPCLPSPSQVRDEPVTDPSRVRDGSLTQNRLDKNRSDKNRSDKNRSDKDSSDKDRSEEGDPKGEPEAERIRHFRTRADFFRRQGWDASSVYALAAREGITQEMIDGREGPS